MRHVSSDGDRQAREGPHPSTIWAAALAIVGLVTAVVANRLLFPLMSGDFDEAVYVAQGRMLAKGQVTLSATSHDPFFHPWLFGQRGGHLFAQYQPGWPAVIAVAHGLGNEHLALAIAGASAVLATWWLTRTLLPRAGAAPLAATLFLVSPIFLVHSALYLSYLWTTALVIGGAAAAMSGSATGRRRAWFACGALFGLAQLSRPVDAVLVAVPITVYVVLTARRSALILRSAAVWAAIGLLPFLAVTALYNAHLTGSAFRFPLQATDRLDTFGFGPRQMMPASPPLQYTERAALGALRTNLGAVPVWFAGDGVGLALAAAAVVRHRRDPRTWFLVTLFGVFPAVYLFWWATSLAVTGARQGLGPHYYVPSFVALAVLAAWSLADVWRRQRLLTAIVSVCVVLGTIVALRPIVQSAHLTTDLQQAKDAPFKNANPANAVVIERADNSYFVLANFPFLQNDPSLHGSVLYAADRGPRVADLATRFPSRQLYQLVLRSEPNRPLMSPVYLLEQLRTLEGSRLILRFSVANTNRDPVVLAYLVVNGRQVAATVLDRSPGPSIVSDLTVELTAPGTVPTPPSAGRLQATLLEDCVIQVGVGFGPDVSADHADLYERQYSVAVDGGPQPFLVTQLPGLHLHLFRYPATVWARQNVGPHLVER